MIRKAFSKYDSHIAPMELQKDTINVIYNYFVPLGLNIYKNCTSK